MLASPRHFEQATALVQPEHIGAKFVCGPDPQAHLDKIDEYVKAGYDEVYVANVGPHYGGFFQLYQREIFPSLRLSGPR